MPGCWGHGCAETPVGDSQAARAVPGLEGAVGFSPVREGAVPWGRRCCSPPSLCGALTGSIATASIICWPSPCAEELHTGGFLCPRGGTAPRSPLLPDRSAAAPCLGAAERFNPGKGKGIAQSSEGVSRVPRAPGDFSCPAEAAEE